ncbi:MAG: sulfurtransferase TusA family protein [Nitrospiraceae bacterium]|nr:sulfurtransferase TusA family protein [Nitrospiraceae bacterium]
MTEQLDARGLSCPQPVIETKKKLSQIKKGTLEVFVDNATAKENVSRMARNSGWGVYVKENNEEYIITLSK